MPPDASTESSQERASSRFFGSFASRSDPPKGFDPRRSVRFGDSSRAPDDETEVQCRPLLGTVGDAALRIRIDQDESKRCAPQVDDRDPHAGRLGVVCARPDIE